MKEIHLSVADLKGSYPLPDKWWELDARWVRLKLEKLLRIPLDGEE